MISNLLKVTQLISEDLSPGSLIPEPLRDKAMVTSWTLALRRSSWLMHFFECFLERRAW